MKAPASFPLRRRLGRAGPVVGLPCGRSHSGKSTFGRGCGNRFEVPSPDPIPDRLGKGFRGRGREPGVGQVSEARKRQALDAGRGVILDACHVSERARRQVRQGPSTCHWRAPAPISAPRSVSPRGSRTWGQSPGATKRSNERSAAAECRFCGRGEGSRFRCARFDGYVLCRDCCIRQMNGHCCVWWELCSATDLRVLEW